MVNVINNKELDFSKAIHNFLLNKLKTTSKVELFGYKNPKVLLNIVDFNNNKYVFIKNYTSKPIEINNKFMISKTSCFKITPNELIGYQNPIVSIQRVNSLIDVSDSLLDINPFKENVYDPVDKIHIVSIQSVNLTDIDYGIVISDDVNYLFSANVGEYIEHFTNHTGFVEVRYTTSTNILRNSRLIDTILYLNDVDQFKCYMDKLIHNKMYNADCESIKQDLFNIISGYEKNKLKQLLSTLTKG